MPSATRIEILLQAASLGETWGFLPLIAEFVEYLFECLYVSVAKSEAYEDLRNFGWKISVNKSLSRYSIESTDFRSVVLLPAVTAGY